MTDRERHMQHHVQRRMAINNSYSEGHSYGTHLAVSNLGHHNEMRRVIDEWWCDQTRPETFEFAAGVVDSLTDWLLVHDSAAHGEPQQ